MIRTLWYKTGLASPSPGLCSAILASLDLGELSPGQNPWWDFPKGWRSALDGFTVASPVLHLSRYYHREPLPVLSSYPKEGVSPSTLPSSSVNHLPRVFLSPIALIRASLRSSIPSGGTRIWTNRFGIVSSFHVVSPVHNTTIRAYTLPTFALSYVVSRATVLAYS